MRTESADVLATDAAALVCMVRDLDPKEVGEHLASLPWERLMQLTVALAAMVPDDKPISELLAWCDPGKKRRDARALAKAAGERYREQALRPCGTHAAFVRHKAAGQQPCLKCLLAEREYQRDRKRRVRAAA